jgi:hypothetical protein
MGAGGNGKPSGEPIPFSVPKATCGPGDHPETALQGQVPAALRASGFKDSTAISKLIGQYRGEGANWQTTEFIDKDGHRCAYHGTASPSRSLRATAARVAGDRRLESKQSDAHRLSHDDVDARSLGIAQGQ